MEPCRISPSDGQCRDVVQRGLNGQKRVGEAAFDGVASTCIVRPTFIYGGDAFGIAPPRVTAEYGSFVESVLSNAAFTALADVLPGLLKVALRAPVSVDAVAAACARAAIGEIDQTVLQGTETINAAADLPVPEEQPVAM